MYDNYKTGFMFGIAIEQLEAVRNRTDIFLLISSDKYYEEFRGQLIEYGKTEFQDFVKGESLGKKKVLIHGNCYGVPISYLLCTNDKFNANYYVYEVSEVWRDENTYENIAGIVKNCDVLIHQNIKSSNFYDYRYADNYLKRQIKKECIEIVFPNLVGMGEIFFPQAYRRAHDYVFQYGDKNIDDFIINAPNADVDDVVKFFEKRTYNKNEIIKTAKTVISKYIEAEKAWDIRVMDYILTTYKFEQAFYDIYHPTNHILVYIARKILELLGIKNLTQMSQSKSDKF